MGDKVIKCRRGEVYQSDFGETIGSEKFGKTIVLIVQNDIGNCYSGTTLVVPIVIQPHNKILAMQVMLHKNKDLIPKDAVIQTEQLRVIDKNRLGEKLGVLPRDIMEKVDNALRISLALDTDELTS